MVEKISPIWTNGMDFPFQEEEKKDCFLGDGRKWKCDGLLLSYSTVVADGSENVDFNLGVCGIRSEFLFW